MFSDASKFNDDLSSWDVSTSKNMEVSASNVD